MTLTAPVSWGELIDKITILEIKLENMTDPEKLANVKHELDVLSKTRDNYALPAGLKDLTAQLKDINQQLWNIEDDIRDQERQKDFGEKFIDLARSVYFTNDKRAALKKEVNILMGSDVVEEKSYQDYE
ncbi:DUF6165 family protein [Curvivirga aplysinae]|uniref:DUF6165 family protein n=1 Tax=Curvivirga aplysinae TaxID=2529852 RepID=UPI0012BC21DF|nr:DUF6165 family protein [Curvivirga aplysinae]MTI10160.1 hypothetical protein [Curvivirga aplysinae]